MRRCVLALARLYCCASKVRYTLRLLDRACLQHRRENAQDTHAYQLVRGRFPRASQCDLQCLFVTPWLSTSRNSVAEHTAVAYRVREFQSLVKLPRRSSVPASGHEHPGLFSHLQCSSGLAFSCSPPSVSSQIHLFACLPPPFHLLLVSPTPATFSWSPPLPSPPLSFFLLVPTPQARHQFRPHRPRLQGSKVLPTPYPLRPLCPSPLVIFRLRSRHFQLHQPFCLGTVIPPHLHP